MAAADSAEDAPEPPAQLRRSRNPTADLLRQRWERLNLRNEHWMCCIVGQEGVGKSYTALKIASMLDPSFDADRVIFDVVNFLEMLRDEEYQPGETYVIDEAGVSLGNRSWQDSEQVKLNQALQLIRSHNLGLVFTLPRLGELDSQTEGRLQDVIELREKNEDEEYVSGSWWELDVDRLNMSSGRDGVFKQKPHFGGTEIDRVRFAPPTGDFISEYEERKQEFQSETYSEIVDGGEDDDKDDAEKASETVLETARQARAEGIEDLLGWHGAHKEPILKKDKIRMKYGLSHANAQQVKEQLRDDPNVDIAAAWDRREKREGEA